MADFFEIDFLDVEADRSGDAITLRYEVDGATYVHVVDGGFQDTGSSVVAHIKKHYGGTTHIHNVVATHPDGDHAGGLRTVLEECDVDALWMLRPWIYADELILRFPRFTSVDNLKKRLREVYPNIAALEEIAEAQGIPICAPFQGSRIGAFTVMTPSRQRYLDLVVSSKKTPEGAIADQERALSALYEAIGRAVAKAANFVKAAWGAEVFSTEKTSAENEMSVVQYALLSGRRILLTADTGCDGLNEAADYAPTVGLALPGINDFQVPHHGSRRNVSTAVLDRWLGARLSQKLEAPKFSAIISSAKKDEDHPRKAVVRAMIHRGGSVATTEGKTVCASQNIHRPGWSSLTPLDYPDEQEE